MVSRKDITSELMMVNTGRIVVDEKYQRQFQPWKVTKIVKEWDDAVRNPPKLSYRDGKYYVFDGQHTVEAEKQRRGGKNCTIECKVYYGLTQEDEEELFLKQTGVSTPVSSGDYLRAEYNFGKGHVVDMVKILESNGIRCDFTKHSGSKKVTAYGAIYKLYEEVGKEDFDAGVKLLMETWNGIASSMTSEVFCAVVRFHCMYDGRYKHSSFVKKLSMVDPKAIVREGRSMVVSSNKFVRVLVNIYNRGRQDYLPQPEELKSLARQNNL